jgi:DNA (cytosine-5)-methyltransferase 1
MTSRPKLLDLFCCGGGAARGYHDAGFDVFGVDIQPQKHFPYPMAVGDALEYVAAHGHEFDAIHASPPCQFGTQLAAMHRSKGPGYDEKHPNLLPQTRAALVATGKPYVIENVEGAKSHMVEPVTLCGTMFNLRTKCGAELRRHRCFETNWLLMCGLECRHYMSDWPCTISVHRQSGGSSKRDKRVIGVNGTGTPIAGARRTIAIHGDHPRDPKVERDNRKGRSISITGSTPQSQIEKNVRRECFSVDAARVAMGIDWLPMKNLSQAIPPAYTQFIGLQMSQVLEVAR